MHQLRAKKIPAWLKYENVEDIVGHVIKPVFSIVNSKSELATYGNSSGHDSKTAIFGDRLVQIVADVKRADLRGRSYTLFDQVSKLAHNNFELCWCAMWNKPLLWSMAEQWRPFSILTSDNVFLLAERALYRDGWNIFELVMTKSAEGTHFPLRQWPSTLVRLYADKVVLNRDMMAKRMAAIFRISEKFYHQVVDCISLAYLEKNLDSLYKVNEYLVATDSPRLYTKSMQFLFRATCTGDDASAAAAAETTQYNNLSDSDNDGTTQYNNLSDSDNDGHFDDSDEDEEAYEDEDEDEDEYEDEHAAATKRDSSTPPATTILSVNQVSLWCDEFFFDDITVYKTFERLASEIPTNWKYHDLFSNLVRRKLSRIRMKTATSQWILLEILLRLDAKKLAFECLHRFHDSADFLRTNPSAFKLDLDTLGYMLEGLDDDFLGFNYLAKIYAFGQCVGYSPQIIGGQSPPSQYDFLYAVRQQVPAQNLLRQFRTNVQAVLADQTNMRFWQPSTISLLHHSEELCVGHYKSLDNKHKFLSMLRVYYSSDLTAMSKWGYDEALWNEVDAFYNLFHHTVAYKNWHSYDCVRHGTVQPGTVEKTMHALIPCLVKLTALDAQHEAQKMFTNEGGFCAHPGVIAFLMYVSTGLPVLQSGERANALSELMVESDIMCDGQVWLFQEEEDGSPAA